MFKSLYFINAIVCSSAQHSEVRGTLNLHFQLTRCPGFIHSQALATNRAGKIKLCIEQGHCVWRGCRAACLIGPISVSHDMCIVIQLVNWNRSSPMSRDEVTYSYMVDWFKCVWLHRACVCGCVSSFSSKLAIVMKHLVGKHVFEVSVCFMNNASPSLDASQYSYTCDSVEVTTFL